MASKNVDALRAAYENWNRRDFEGLVRNVTDEVSYVDHPSGRTISGKEGFRQYVEQWAKAMSDGRIKDPEFIDAGDVVVAQFTGVGTNDGPFAGLPPTGKPVSFAFCEVWRFDKNGRMSAGHAYYDLYSMLTQLGHIRPVAQAA